MENTNSMTEILLQEDVILEKILQSQICIKEAVTKRNWVELEKNISKMQGFAADFIELDNQRELMQKGPVSPENHILMKQIQSKLLKSKIVNSALNDYIKVSRGFVQNVLENAVPQRKNVLYSKSGTLVKPLPESVVLNKVF